ncbi:MAG: squalene synthase HpnC [Pseudomonadota bacterium]
MDKTAVETPSGKGAGDENFPVGSWLLPVHLRPHVAKFYAFARAIDDIADNPDLDAHDKIERLDRMEGALLDDSDRSLELSTAHRLRDSLKATRVTARHGQDLIAAFKQDALKSRYDDWADLLGYCRLSANPVGRYLLDLHGEEADDYPPSDALCTALQILNHLQDCQDDFFNLDRVYLPQDWMDAAGLTVEVLKSRQSPVAFRQLLDLCLDGVDQQLAIARQLPRQLKSGRLAMESAVIVKLAERLSILLRKGDPLARRVALQKGDFIKCGLWGISSVMFARGTGRHRAGRPAAAEGP